MDDIVYLFHLLHIGIIYRQFAPQKFIKYPVKAIREVIRNVIVHRDYSLTGKDVKVSINDNMVEITSPGLLPPSIDYNDMLSRQSDVRNKVLAPVFKRLGLIDQWGNGLALIHDELKAYPNVRMTWKEVGLSFQVAFERKVLANAESARESIQEIPKKMFKNQYKKTLKKYCPTLL